MIFNYIMKVFIVLILRAVGIVILVPITYKYRLGDFPRWCRWFDDYRGYRMSKLSKLNRLPWCVQHFGEGHCDLYNKYNDSWYLRYVWSAWRNTTNYFKHQTIGIDYWPGDASFHSDYNYREISYSYEDLPTEIFAWEYSRINGNEVKIPLIPYGIRLRFGYKMDNLEHVQHMRYIGVPLEFAFSIGIRRITV